MIISIPLRYFCSSVAKVNSDGKRPHSDEADPDGQDSPPKK